MNRLLENKVAIVTGGSQGLGLAVSMALGVDGAKVIVPSRSRERAESAVESIRSLGGIAAPCVMDLCDGAAAECVVGEALSAFGGLDILVNCAGLFIWKPFLELSFEEWKSVIDTNLSSAFRMMQSAARVMIDRRRGGAIVSIASIHGTHVDPNVVAQCASKFGLIGLTRAAAEALRPYDIRVNAISPGSIEADSALRRGESPRQRVTQADVASLVVYLSSDLSRSITGTVVDAYGSTRVQIKA